MKRLTCILSANDCYTSGRTIKPKGVMVHSTGANNTGVKRYVQPAANDPDRAALLAALGTNANKNDWNRPGVDKCVHAFVGKLADGTVAAVQTLPWDRRGWHAGSGKTGSANDTHISFEICEDDLTDPVYFGQIYRTAVELTAYLCREYSLDPLADGVVICHSEGYKRGIASNHGDVTHWFPKQGKTMDDFRADVVAEMNGSQTPAVTVSYQGKVTAKAGLNCRTAPVSGAVIRAYPYGTVLEITKEQDGWGYTGIGWVSLEFIEKITLEISAEEDDDMDQSKFNEMFEVAMAAHRAALQAREGNPWSQADREWGTENGLFEGGDSGFMWQDVLTREQAAALFRRFAKLFGSE